MRFFDSKLPVITGIGHERDITIADLVADKSLSTPTAVAAFIRTQREQLIQKIEVGQEQLIALTQSILEDTGTSMEFLIQDIFSGFNYIIQRYSFSVRHCTEKMHGCLKSVFDSFRAIERRFINKLSEWHVSIKQIENRVSNLSNQVVSGFFSELEDTRKKIEIAQAKLVSLNPESILNKGYSIVYDEKGNVIRSSEQVNRKDTIRIKLHREKLFQPLKRFRTLKSGEKYERKGKIENRLTEA